ncbi:PAS domain-containing protein [Alkalilacustris brevis]|uniref:PAS domain-containing protein n=1 Tax=Alkalilacustris brevis TaxID=2026338 RepID=UPI00138FBE28|nr:PAS domain-containing protein [Alkalilacustris brevis]
MPDNTPIDPPRISPGADTGLAGHSAARLRLPALDTIEAYWEALRGLTQGAPALPRRTDIDPRGIENALSQAFLAERIAPGVARLRVAGDALAGLLGAEPRGLPLTVPIAGAQRAEFSELVERVFAAPALVECALFSPRGFRRPALRGRLLLLPLRGAQGQIDCALGALALEGAPGPTPRRFSFTPLRCRQIGAAAAHSAASPASGSTAAAAAAAISAATPRAARPYLRLVTSD